MIKWLTSLTVATCLTGCAALHGIQTRTIEEITGPPVPDQGSELYLNAISEIETGVTLIEPKIVGGAPILLTEAPWQVALLVAKFKDKNVAFCGGTLIDRRWVVTAAHCVDSRTKANSIEIFSGKADLSNTIDRIKVTNVYIHPNYVPEDEQAIPEKPPYNDIALLRLKTPIQAPADIAGLASIDSADHSIFSDPGYEAPIEEENRILAFASGWGATIVDGPRQRKLHGVELPLVDQGICNDLNAYGDALTEEPVITAQQICAGYAQGGRDTCRGDSGGPLVWRGAEEPILVGVTSWGDSCADPNKYGVYTRISSYRDWIDDCIDHGRCRQ